MKEICLHVVILRLLKCRPDPWVKLQPSTVNILLDLFLYSELNHLDSESRENETVFVDSILFTGSNSLFESALYSVEAKTFSYTSFLAELHYWGHCIH